MYNYAVCGVKQVTHIMYACIYSKLCLLEYVVTINQTVGRVDGQILLVFDTLMGMCRGLSLIYMSNNCMCYSNSHTTVKL